MRNARIPEATLTAIVIAAVMELVDSATYFRKQMGAENGDAPGKR